MKILLAALVCLFTSLACCAADSRFTVVRIDTRTEHLEMFLHDEAGKPFNRFERLSSSLTARNKRLRFAMNAGMFQSDFSPVGLLVLGGREEAPLNLTSGSGNFFLKPNGVFLVTPSGPRVVESSEYPAFAKSVLLATQSGPLLVRNGAIHPGLSAGSKSRLIRNGVGVSETTAVFVISEQPVTLHEFASYFRDNLHCLDALYLDGTVSSLHSIALHRSDFKANLGPIIGVVE